MQYIHNYGVGIHHCTCYDPCHTLLPFMDNVTIYITTQSCYFRELAYYRHSLARLALDEGRIYPEARDNGTDCPAGLCVVLHTFG